jgi:hypothetical protein
MTTIRAADLWRLAEAKWAEIAVNTPDLAPALAVQKGLLRLLVDATEAFQIPAGAILWELTPDLVLAKWAREVPAFRHESVVIPSALKGILPLVCDVLAEGGAGDSARHIKNALVTGAIDAGSLLSVSFARNQKAIRTSSIHMGLAPDLVWLVGELGSSPLAHRLQATLIAQPELHDAVLDWNRGYCPCCGSWPALVEMLDGARMLRCSYCAAAWELRSYRCIYCGNEDGRFLAAAPDMARKDRRLELCGSCGKYTKVIEVNGLTPFPLVAIEDLASLDLDQGAMSREYSRPALFDVDAIDPPPLARCP